MWEVMNPMVKENMMEVMGLVQQLVEKIVEDILVEAIENIGFRIVWT